MSDKDKKRLRLIQGGRRDRVRVGGVLVAVGPAQAPPFSVSHRVFEEDTYLVLSADPVIGADRLEHPIRMMTDLLEQEPARPGSVLVRGNRLLAVVHDLDCEPTCREQWVRSALCESLHEVRRRRLRSLGLPLLGSVHGRIAYQRSLKLIEQALRTGDTQHLERVWLIVPRRWLAAVERLLAHWES